MMTFVLKNRFRFHQFQVIKIRKKWEPRHHACSLVTVSRNLRIYTTFVNQRYMGLSAHLLNKSAPRINLSASLSHSNHYPDFFVESTDDSADLTNPVKILELLENANFKGEYELGIKVFEEFQAVKPDWSKQWPAQKIAASVLHMYLKMGHYDKLFMLYDDLRKMGFVHGEGIFMILIKCCIASNDFMKALTYLKELKIIGLRNIRIYSNIIKSLLDNDKLELAFKLFKEMQKEEFGQRSKKQLKDQKMLSSLLIATTKKAGHSYRGTAPLSRESLIAIVDNVLDYICVRGITVSSDLKDAILKTISCFEGEYRLENLEDHELQSQETCRSCDGGINEPDLETFITKLRTFSKSSEGLAENENLINLVKKHGPFDVVIDGANVMLARQDRNTKQLTKVTENNLIGVLECCKVSFSLNKSLIILPSKMARRSLFKHDQFYEEVQDLYDIEILIVENLKDDIAALLACLYNDALLLQTGLNGNTKLVTNDSLREHVSIVGEHQLRFHLWIQSKQMRFSWSWDDRIILRRSSLQILQKNNKAWLLPLTSGQLHKVVKNLPNYQSQLD